MENEKLMPLPKPKTIDFGSKAIGQIIEVHAERLASFKSTLSRYNKKYETDIKFSYSDLNGSFFTATRIL